MSTSPVRITPSAQGKGYRLELSQRLPASRNQVFDFFSDAFRLEELTPPWLSFAVLTPPPIELKAGSLIDYRLRLHGIPFRWRTRISVWEPPFRFIDEQLWGPYRRWRHEHIFSENEAGTLCQDIVDYEVFGGSLVNRLIVQPDVVRIFTYRQERLLAHFARP